MHRQCAEPLWEPGQCAAGDLVNLFPQQVFLRITGRTGEGKFCLFGVREACSRFAEVTCRRQMATHYILPQPAKRGLALETGLQSEENGDLSPHSNLITPEASSFGVHPECDNASGARLRRHQGRC
jgi:hypothetical protein